MQLNSQHVELAFSDGSLDVPHLETVVTFSTKALPPLTVTTGRIVACDPLVFPDSAPFSVPVPNGTHAVQLAIADIDSDERVAFARVVFLQAPIVKWEMAISEGLDLSEFEPDDRIGYGVDSGNGCFADVAAMQALQARMDSIDDYFLEIVAESDKTYVPTWSWASIAFRPKTESNLLIFSSGYGDGVYPSWFGYTSDGRVAALVTEFDILYDEFEEADLG